jgi:hypothetical protein
VVSVRAYWMASGERSPIELMIFGTSWNSSQLVRKIRSQGNLLGYSYLVEE